MNLIVLAISASLLVFYVHAGSVTSGRENYDVNKGQSVTLLWNISPAANEQVFGVKLYNSSVSDEHLVWDNGATIKYKDKSKEMFGDRFSAHYDNTNLENQKVSATINNAQLNDSSTLVLNILFFNTGTNTGTPFPKEISFEVKSGPESCSAEVMKTETSFNFSTTPAIDICISGNPQPTVSYIFDGVTFQTSEPVTLDSVFYKYEYKLLLPQLKASHCGKELSYTASSTLKGSSEITGKTKIIILDFPLDVTLLLFTYVNEIPVASWSKVESGDCDISYFLTITNQTSQIERGPITGLSLQVPEMSEPTDVKIYAMYGSKKGPMSAPKDFQKTTTTTTTTTTTIKPVPSIQNEDDDSGSNLGAIIGGAIGGTIFIIFIVILVVCIVKKKRFDSKANRSTNVKVNTPVGGNENNANTGSHMDMEELNGKPNNHYTRVSEEPLHKNDDPNQAIYSELGPGGRVGPKPTPASSDYAEVKIDENGFPITGETNDQSLYDHVRRDSDDFDTGVIV